MKGDARREAIKWGGGGVRRVVLSRVRQPGSSQALPPHNQPWPDSTACGLPPRPRVADVSSGGEEEGGGGKIIYKI